MEKNEFKFSALRQFGSENITFTSVIRSDKQTLTDEEIEAQVKQVDTLISTAFKQVQEREIRENGLLAEASDRRKENIKKLDEALKAEMEAKSNAQITMNKAEKLSNKLTKQSNGK